MFLMVFDSVYERDLDDPTVPSSYGYAIEIASSSSRIVATVMAIRQWAAERGHQVTWFTVLCLFMLWANFSPLYGVLAIKNVELWELARIAVAGAALLWTVRG